MRRSLCLSVMPASDYEIYVVVVIVAENLHTGLPKALIHGRFYVFLMLSALNRNIQVERFTVLFRRAHSHIYHHRSIFLLVDGRYVILRSVDRRRIYSWHSFDMAALSCRFSPAHQHTTTHEM